MRKYKDEGDYWRIRAFLREVYLLNGRRELGWQAYRFDYWRWHVVLNCGHCDPIEEVTYLWETDDGQIAAVLHSEGRMDACLEVHPQRQRPGLEEEMVSLAEEQLGATDKEGARKIRVMAHEDGTQRREMLARRGYKRVDWREHQRRRLLSIPVPNAKLPEGYSVRAVRGVQEFPARSWVSWRAFHPDEPDEDYEGYDWYDNIQRAPLYRRDLDIVAVAQDGELASFCTVWFDDVSRTGAFEPVGTSPEYQRRGLGKAVMLEGLRRLKLKGATLATVSSYEPAAHGLYASAGFNEYDIVEPWEKIVG
jgi:ribosomal protein S18 acetylase RimI-like enzyme